jgi:N utilization substance protein B
VEALYESDLRSQSVDEALDSLASRMQTPVNAYTETIVRGVSQHRDQIDETLATYAQGWTLDRMPAVDRAILRVGAWEVLWGDVPDGVALAEAVGLANDLSTDESGKYINGVLARIKDVKPRLSLGE